jgi:hypothetical protein
MKVAIPQKSSRWFPSANQLKDPAATERAFRQLLQQHYALQDRFDALHAQVNAPAIVTGPLPGHGPSDTQILGLNVLPIDTNSLADGTKLTFVKSDGNFAFK